MKPHGFTVHVNGIRLTLSGESPEIIERASRFIMLPDWRREPLQEGDIELEIVQNQHGHLEILEDGERAGTAARVEDLQDTLQFLAHHRLATLADDVFVHAGVVAVNGKALLLPGRTHAGKSTLVKALVEAGATFYSDEFAVFKEDGLVRAFLRPLSLRYPEARRVPLDELNFQGDVPPAIPVGHVLSLRFDASAGWDVEAQTPGHTVLSLLDNTVAAQRLGAQALTLLSRSIGPGPHYKGTRADAAEAAQRVLELTAREP